VSCTEYREILLDSVGKQLPSEMKVHLSLCPECRLFDKTQSTLHARFLVSSSASLSASFRVALGERITPERASAWPDFLPDVAHLSGCMTATLVSVFVLPWPKVQIAVTGAVLTGITYVLQAKLRDAFQAD
jgi:hypothetical protein